MNKIKLSEGSKQQLADLMVRWCNMEQISGIYKTIGISRDLCYKWRHGDATFFTDTMCYNIAIALEVSQEDLLTYLYGKIDLETFWQTTRFKKKKEIIEVEEESGEKSLPSPVLRAMLDYWEMLSRTDRDILRFRLGIVKEEKPYYSFPLIKFTSVSQYQLAQVVVKMCRGSTPLSEWLKAGIKPEILDVFFNVLRSDVITIATKYFQAEDFIPLLRKIYVINSVKGTEIELDKTKTYEDDLDSFFIDCERFSSPTTKRPIADLVNEKIAKNNLTQTILNIRLSAFDFDLNRFRAIRYGHLTPSKKEVTLTRIIVDPLGQTTLWENTLENVKIEEYNVIRFGRKLENAVPQIS